MAQKNTTASDAEEGASVGMVVGRVTVASVMAYQDVSTADFDISAGSAEAAPCAIMGISEALVGIVAEGPFAPTALYEQDVGYAMVPAFASMGTSGQHVKNVGAPVSASIIGFANIAPCVVVALCVNMGE